MATWEIAGEVGASLDDTKVSFESLSIEGATLFFESEEKDKFTYEERFVDMADANTVDIGQIVEVFRNGTRVFSGNVTDRKTEDTQEGIIISTTVSGPWWWLENTPLSGDVVDGTGATVERMLFEFAGDDLKDSLTTIINRTITLGCPIALGSISTCFDVPSITIANKSCANGIADLMQWIPDAVTWFDYSAATPTLNITRRPSATNYDFVTGGAPVNSTSINPKLELQVDQVRILYADRDANDNVKFIELSSGDSGTAQAGGSTTITLASTASISDDAYTSLTVTIDSGTGSGQTKTITDYVGSTKVATVNSAWTTNPDATSVYTVGSGSGTGARPARQIITVSGPEINAFLPKDYFDNETVQTASLTGVAAFNALDPRLVANGATMSQATVINFSGSIWKRAEISSPKYLTTKGEPLPSGYNYYLTKGEYRPWMKDSGYGFIECIGRTTLEYNPSGSGSLWDRLSTSGRKMCFYNYTNSSSGDADARNDIQFFSSSTEDPKYFAWYQSQINFVACNTNFSSATTIYREQDYGFTNPPADMASSLQSTQNWTPYEGTINITENDIGGVNYFDKKINLTNSLTEHATMGALPKSVEHDIANYRTTIELGAPDRLSFKGLVNKFRQTDRNNIIYT